MKLTGGRYVYEGSVEGPILVAMWFGFGGRRGFFKRRAEALYERCKELDLSCVIVKIREEDMPDSIRNHRNTPTKNPAGWHRRSKWIRAVPFFMLQMLEEYQKPIVYVHVDAEVEKSPPASLFDNSIVVSTGSSKALKGGVKQRKHILVSGIYASGNADSIYFLERWKRYCDDPDDPRKDHRLLKVTLSDMILEHPTPGITIREGLCSRARGEAYFYV